MRIKKHIPTLIALTAALTLGVSLYTHINNPYTEVKATQVNTNFSPYTYSGTYYSGIDFTASEGMNGGLRQALTTLIKPKAFVDYSSGLSEHLQHADENPDNTNNMVLFYTRDSVTKHGATDWNREHVWPKSLSNGNWGTSKGGTDILHLRPTYNTPNSTRSSHPFGDAPNGDTKVFNNLTYAKLDGDIFEPLDCVKGDVARIIMYTWTVYDTYPGYNHLDIEDVFESYNTLLEWHTNDKPDQLEGHRNDYVQNSTVQKNRNPFVDHPELGWKIFGSQVSTSVLNACKQVYPANGGTPITPTGISLNRSTASVEEGATLQLTATLSPTGATGTITWSTSNANVATVNSSGRVTGVAQGNATITATCGNYSASCTVTVTEPVPTNYGTFAHPLTVSQAKTLIDEANPTAEKMYVKGIVSSNTGLNAQYNNQDEIWLQSEDGLDDHAFELYHVSIDSNVQGDYDDADSLVGQEVIAYGYGKKYNSTYELAKVNNDSPVVLSVGSLEATGISLNRNTAELEVDDTVTLTATLTPANSTSLITWTTSNANVATVNNGVVTGVASGTAVITAKVSDSVKAQCTVTVTAPAVYYTVSFNSNGGTAVNSQSVLKGTQAQQPANPTKASDNDYNYTFGGWYLNADCTGEAYNFSSAVNSSFTLYAKWNATPIPAKDRIEALTTTTTLAYHYDTSTSGTSATDTFGANFTGATSTSYINWNNVGSSGVKYAGNSACDHGAIQMRSSNNNSGIVVTNNTDGLTASSITVAWNSSTISNRTIEVYGKNTAYDSASNLYNASSRGTQLGTIRCGTSTSLTITGSYEYIGFKSSSGALYIDSVTIQWGSSETTYEYSNVSIRFGGLLSQDLWNSLDTDNHVIEGFGVMMVTDSVISDEMSIVDFYDVAVSADLNPDNNSELVDYYMSKEEMATPVVDGNNYYWNLFYRINTANLQTTYVAAAYIKTSTEYIFMQEVRYSAKSLAADYIANRGCNAETAGGSLANLANL